MKQRDESTHSSKLNNETVSYFYCIFFYNRTLLRNSPSRNIKRVTYPNHIAAFLIEH